MPTANGHAMSAEPQDLPAWLTELNDAFRRVQGSHDADAFHGDSLLADPVVAQTPIWSDIGKVISHPKNLPEIAKFLWAEIRWRKFPDGLTLARLVSALPNDSTLRTNSFEAQGVKEKYDKMLHPPLTYLGDDFTYRAPDGKFNSVLHPSLGQAGTTYSKTVPSVTHQLGALPDSGDLFDTLMARETDRPSRSGLSAMLIYHATVIIHDIFRTNDYDKNISDTSSYLDLSPLYGYNKEMQSKVRDTTFKLGLLKPDTFAEDRLLRQPPGVCTYLIMWNRYHNHAATQLRRINENNRFAVPHKYTRPKLMSAIESGDFALPKSTSEMEQASQRYQAAVKQWEDEGRKVNDAELVVAEKAFLEQIKHAISKPFVDQLDQTTDGIERAVIKEDCKQELDKLDAFLAAYEAAWDKLDDDLFNTARLITCGLYINISIHDYLRALMGFHQFDTDFTLDPTKNFPGLETVTRGLGNQVTVEFNLLYRFHCAISKRDEEYTEALIREIEEEMILYQEKALQTQKADHALDAANGSASQLTKHQEPPQVIDPKKMPMDQFLKLMRAMAVGERKDPWLIEFGLKHNENLNFTRNTITGLFDDEKLIANLKICLNDPISNFGPKNVPKALRNVEIMGIEQARKWSCGTLNDFRSFFQLPRHKTFADITVNETVQDALRDLYECPDKVELYPGIFCECEADLDEDPGPRSDDKTMALWAAIFSDAITLVRSDRFFTVDWNTDSLTSWGMKEVIPEPGLLKSSVFHRLFQRAFPQWFPYDSLHFFHPFYTNQMNGKYAQEQGYGGTFAVTERHPKNKNDPYDATASQPVKPVKPTVFAKYDEIKWVLDAPAANVVHPAWADKKNLPKAIVDALETFKNGSSKNFYDVDAKKLAQEQEEIQEIATAYFTHYTRKILARDSILKSSDPASENSLYQIDVTRDLAVPLITRTIADFLGFGQKIKTLLNPSASYSENEIYQHITNVQAFLSYNSDETKLLKRRIHFNRSLKFLLKLTENGYIAELDRWGAWTSWLNCFGHKEDSLSNSFRNIGRKAAKEILGMVKDKGTAAAILLLVALEISYLSVFAFTASLDDLLAGAYKTAQDIIHVNSELDCDWFRLQRLALDTQNFNGKEIEAIVLRAQSSSIKMPLIRKVVKDCITTSGKALKKGDTIICDVYKAMNTSDQTELGLIKEYGHLNYITSLSEDFVRFNPKNLAITAVTTLLTVSAQLKDLRRSPTSQGILKRVQIDQTSEGYANYIAPGRMKRIVFDAKHAQAEYDEEIEREKRMTKEEKDKCSDILELKAKRASDAKKVWSPDLLEPATETFLTAEWDEFVPFPSTWKLYFEGYGPSTYNTPPPYLPGQDAQTSRLGKLRPPRTPDDIPPWYQPRTKGQDEESEVDKEDKKRNTKVVVGATPPASMGCGAPVTYRYATEQPSAVQTSE